MVEWKNIGDICEIIRGNGVQKTDFVEEGVGCIHYGQIYTHYGPFTYSTNKFVSIETFDKARKASKGDIVMTDTSENVEDICKSVAYLGEDDIAVSNHALILKHNQNPKFLSYSTLTNSFLDQKRKFVVGVKVSGIKPEQLAKIKIYLPSLPEQNRIVGILDTFTSSIENLKEQIAQHRKQYEHYRDQLLDLEGKEGGGMKTLGELCGIYDGTHQTPRYQDEGVKFVSVENIGNIYASNKYISFDDFQKNYRVKPQKDDVLMTRIGDVGRCAVIEKDEPIAYYVSLALLRPDHEVAISKYIKYSLESNTGKIELRKRTLLTAVPLKINLGDVGKIKIPYFPMEEQSRIVSILDTFEASIANLEAQLKEREKQYEYYRNKLLTFE